MIFAKEKQYTIYQASCLDIMDSMEKNSIDCIITDPPYEIGFMNKGWDNTGIAFDIETWKKALRVLKPGGYLLAFNHSRTFHRMMVAIEDAGFELRDTIMWLYGSGFPKSHNIAKAIDKQNGYDGEIIGVAKGVGNNNTNSMKNGLGSSQEFASEYNIKQLSQEAKKWDGWGTALKPAFEPIVMARKPFKGSVAENVLKYGVGGINIEDCRIETNGEQLNVGGRGKHDRGGGYGFKPMGDYEIPENQGRFPSNIIHDGSEEVLKGFPHTKQGGNIDKPYKMNNQVYGDYNSCKSWQSYEDSGSASRYFYCAKASVKDREEGLLDVKDLKNDSKLNFHPTVKPTDLMQYLIRLVAPKGSKVLDIFMGSGSTGKACMIENVERDANYHFIGIDLDLDENGNEAGYCKIAQARIEFGINFRELEKEQQETYEDIDESGNKIILKQEKLF